MREKMKVKIWLVFLVTLSFVMCSCANSRSESTGNNVGSFSASIDNVQVVATIPNSQFKDIQMKLSISSKTNEKILFDKIEIKYYSDEKLISGATYIYAKGMSGVGNDFIGYFPDINATNPPGVSGEIEYTLKQNDNVTIDIQTGNTRFADKALYKNRVAEILVYHKNELIHDPIKLQIKL